MRVIAIEIRQDGTIVFSNKTVGIIGEHNATELDITIPESANIADCFVINFLTGGRTILSPVITEETIEDGAWLDGNHIHCILWQELVDHRYLSFTIDGLVYSEDGSLKELFKLPMVKNLSVDQSVDSCDISDRTPKGILTQLSKIKDFLKEQLNLKPIVDENTRLRHSHDNKSVIDNFADAGTGLTYKGAPIAGDTRVDELVEWAEKADEKLGEVSENTRARHSHLNQNILDKLEDDNGLSYNGHVLADANSVNLLNRWAEGIDRDNIERDTKINEGIISSEKKNLLYKFDDSNGLTYSGEKVLTEEKDTFTSLELNKTYESLSVRDDPEDVLFYFDSNITAFTVEMETDLGNYIFVREAIDAVSGLPVRFLRVNSDYEEYTLFFRDYHSGSETYPKGWYKRSGSEFISSDPPEFENITFVKFIYGEDEYQDLSSLPRSALMALRSFSEILNVPEELNKKMYHNSKLVIRFDGRFKCGFRHFFRAIRNTEFVLPELGDDFSMVMDCTGDQDISFGDCEIYDNNYPNTEDGLHELLFCALEPANKWAVGGLNFGDDDVV